MWPQMPQLSGSVCLLVHKGPQVSGALESTHRQLPAEQAPLSQVVPQAPQLFASVKRSVQMLLAPTPQTWGALAGHWQCPDRQSWSALQAAPQAPQLFRSSWMSVHSAFGVPALQKSGMCAGQAHWPLAQS